jgi:hypothetical protein
MDAASISTGMHEGKAQKPAWILGRNPGCIGVCLLIVTVKRRENNCFLNSRCLCPLEVEFDRGAGAPGASQQVAFSSVAVAVNDHK